MWTMVILGREQMSGGQIFGVQMSGYDNNNNNNNNNTASNSSSSFVRDYLSTAAPIRSRDRHTSVTTSCLATLIFNYRLNNAVRFFFMRHERNHRFSVCTGDEKSAGFAHWLDY